MPSHPAAPHSDFRIVPAQLALRGLFGRASLLVTALVALTVSCLAACGGGLAPVLNVNHAPVVTRGEKATRESVREAILSALAARRWAIEREGPDGIVASTALGSNGANGATVHVEYDDRSYSIHYLDSSPSLRFNGTTIHRKYNSWVEQLNRSIRAELAGSHSRQRWGRGQPPPDVYVAPPAATPPPPAAPAPVAPPAADADDELPPPPPPPATPRK